MRAMNGGVLCRLEDIPDGGSAGFAVDDGADGGGHGGGCGEDGPVQVLAVRRGTQVFVYVNICPHWGSPLDLVPGQFLDADKRHILCSTHGAIFRIEDGLCVKGACLGGRLRPVAVQVADGIVRLAAD